MRLNSEKTPAADENFEGSRYGHAGVQVGSREEVIGLCVRIHIFCTGTDEFSITA
jgi:hypothetical protein